MVLKLKWFSERKTEGTIFLAEEGIEGYRETHLFSMAEMQCIHTEIVSNTCTKSSLGFTVRSSNCQDFGSYSVEKTVERGVSWWMLF